jgi:hypothetical protein
MPASPGDTLPGDPADIISQGAFHEGKEFFFQIIDPKQTFNDPH